MTCPRVSVIIASYNHAPFIRESVLSALNQSINGLEVVLTDDGSSDSTLEQARSIDDPRLRIYPFEENRGACFAANNSIERSTGEYVAILNSDDYFLPGKLTRQVEFLDANPHIGAVFGMPLFVDQHGKALPDYGHAFSGLFCAQNRSRTEWLLRLFTNGNCLCHPTVLVRREVYRQVGLLNPMLMQLPDLEFWVRLCARFDIHVMSQKLTAFRVLPNEANTSAPTAERVARHAWEIAQVLRVYGQFTPTLLERIFATLPTLCTENRRIDLALRCIETRQPGYLQFGTQLLSDEVQLCASCFTPRQVFEIIGQTDPFCANHYRGLYRWIHRSPVVRMCDLILRRVNRRLRKHGRSVS